MWGAFDGTTTVGTFRSWATELTVPGGGRLPGAAVTGVTVRPSHRRRGILTDMAAAGHAAARASGEAVGILYAAEYAIYGRFGYGPAAREATLTVDASAPGFHHPARGTVELVKASAEVAQVIKGVFEAWRARQVGELARRDYRWDFELGLRESVWGPRWNGFVALHRDEAGTVDGYVRYKAEEKWAQRQPRAVVTIDELHALTDDAYEALWQFLVRMDLVTVIKAERRHPAERLPWLLTNARSVEIADVGDGLWLALLDVPRALAARTYAREGSLVLEVIEGAGTPTRDALTAAAQGWSRRRDLQAHRPLSRPDARCLGAERGLPGRRPSQGHGPCPRLRRASTGRASRGRRHVRHPRPALVLHLLLSW